jgi:hypothetical protein
LSGNDFSGYFDRSFLAGSERLGDDHRMTDAAHNQHTDIISAQHFWTRSAIFKPSGKLSSA